MKKFSYIAVLAVIMNLLIPVYADSIKSLYQAQIPVNSQSVDERNAVLQSALQQVLIKVSGNSQILNNPDITHSITDLNTMIQAFGYTKATNGQGYILTILFDKGSVNQLLLQAKVPVWGSERPLLLVWAEWEVFDKPAEIIGSDSPHPLVALLTQNAENRGIPIAFPTMDLNDINAVAVNDIVNMSIPPLQSASQRYHSDGLLIVRAFQLTNGSNVQAKLVLGNDQWSWNLQSATLDDNLRILVNNVSDVLAARYSTLINDPGQQTQTTVKIVGVNRHGDLLQILRYLKRLTPVAEVEPTAVSGQEVVLSINLRGSQTSLLSAISAENKLTLVSDLNTDKTLVYRWNP